MKIIDDQNEKNEKKNLMIKNNKMLISSIVEVNMQYKRFLFIEKKLHFVHYEFLYILLYINTVSYTHLRAHETRHDLVCRLLLEKKKKKKKQNKQKKQKKKNKTIKRQNRINKNKQKKNIKYITK
eukprot:TRINITY_DN682_c0_g1_i4.p4 TRINITY_DN682_c0_g1~~TRINITY_DN682_c0_g1_i4.p4  ORF type:complete len:125 (-),score=35.14 TRINITY_DN682_c0_g1_i4:6-380(-)